MCVNVCMGTCIYIFVKTYVPLFLPVLNFFTISLVASTSSIGILLDLSIFNLRTPLNVTLLFTSSTCFVYALKDSLEFVLEAYK
jgi:hypothetical protein